MGGKALLPQVPDLKRLSASEYKVITKEVIEKIGRTFSSWGGYFKLIPSYERKEDFGDADYIASQSFFNFAPNWVEMVKIALNSKAIFHESNSNTWSFEYKNFQIDIIVVPDEYYDFAYCYFSYNDTGNLMGRIAKRMGFKLGFDGLWIEAKVGTEKLKDILVTQNWYESLNLLGWNLYSWGYGLRTLNDIYAYILQSEYFDKECFLMENRNHRDRNRDLKRTTYMGFLEYIDKPTVVSKFDFASGKQPWVAKLKKTFPRVLEDYKSLLEEWKLDKLLRTKFNGEVVHSLTGFKEKDLGDFMSKYRKSFDSESKFKQFILASQPETIADSIDKYKTTFDEIIEEARRTEEAILKKKVKEERNAKKGQSFKEEQELLNKSKKSEEGLQAF